MASFINLLASDLWSEADILARVRAQVEGIVPTARQDELRTIMLGHIAQMRVATPTELGEIMQVGALTEQAAVDAAAARADMALLTQVIALEAAFDQTMLPAPEFALVETMDEQGVLILVASPEAVKDNDERMAAANVIQVTSEMPEVLALFDLRNPVPEEEVEVAP